MTKRHWILFLAMSLLLAAAPACSKKQSPQPQPQSTPVLAAGAASPTPSPPATPTRPLPTATVTPSPTPPTPSPTATLSAHEPAVTDVQFALDVDQAGQLIYPGDTFVFGVTRMFVRFDYQGLEDVTEAQSMWYLNDNRVISGTLAWDGGDAGAYIIWAEDRTGLGRGQWRWEFEVDGISLGGSAFTIGGEPRYANPAWGLSMDPPMTWQIASEEENFVTFSSPDQQQALALRVSPLAAGLTETVTTNTLTETVTNTLTETVAADLATFRQDHPDAEVVATQDVTMSGKKALMQEARYTDQESGERVLYMVSALHAGSAYHLWMLGPADSADVLQALLVVTLRSISFSR